MKFYQRPAGNSGMSGSISRHTCACRFRVRCRSSCRLMRCRWNSRGDPRIGGWWRHSSGTVRWCLEAVYFYSCVIKSRSVICSLWCGSQIFHCGNFVCRKFDHGVIFEQILTFVRLAETFHTKIAHSRSLYMSDMTCVKCKNGRNDLRFGWCR